MGASFFEVAVVLATTIGAGCDAAFLNSGMTLC